MFTKLETRGTSLSPRLTKQRRTIDSMRARKTATRLMTPVCIFLCLEISGSLITILFRGRADNREQAESWGEGEVSSTSSWNIRWLGAAREWRGWWIWRGEGIEEGPNCSCKWYRSRKQRQFLYYLDHVLTSPLQARMHGNEPSRGAKIDAELQKEEEEELRRKGKLN